MTSPVAASRVRVVAPGDRHGVGAAVQQPRPADAGRHEHLGAAWSRAATRWWSSTQGPTTTSTSRKIAELGKIPLVLISHKHEDHTGGIDKIVDRTGAVVRSVGSGFLRGLGGPLTDGEVIDAAGLRITVMATPGHTADSLSFLLDDAVLTADTVLGRGTTVIDTEDGSLGDYLESLRAAAGPGQSDGAAGARPRSRRSRGRHRDVPDAPRGAARRRCATRCGHSATTPPRARSSNTSTPTSTKSYGTPPNGACRPSSTTYALTVNTARGRSAPLGLGGPAARSRRSARSCPPGGSSRGGRNRRAPC